MTRPRRSTPAPDEYAGRVVVITGAGSGIGRATALAFARRGAKVHVVDLDGGRAKAALREIEAGGGRGAARVVDCTDPVAVEALAEAVFAEDGAVDILHNNAGIGHTGLIEDTTLEDWQRVLGINLMGVVHGVHSFVPRMLRQGRPSHVVNTASGLGLVASAELAPYCASKFGVVGLSEALNAELSPKGIRVTALCPGVVDTAIVDHAIYRGEALQHAARGRDFYHSRGASAESVAEAVLDAVRKKRLIQTTPWLHVHPLWLLKRISPRAAQVLARNMPRLLRGGR